MQPYEMGGTPNYAPNYAYNGAQPQQQPVYNDSKNPYEGDRFKPKSKVNDPIFLVFFILQVRAHDWFEHLTLICGISSSPDSAPFLALPSRLMSEKVGFQAV